ncbi:MAG: protease pro-enzyme activation domain-containing protein [Acidimicrobiales bacterium]
MNFWSARRTVIASAALAVIAIGVIVTLHGLGRHPDASLLPGRDGSGGYPTVVGGRPVGTPSGVGASLHLAGAHPSRAPAGIGISDRASSAVAPAPPVPAQSVPVGPVPAATNLTVDVGLQPADPAALTRFDTAVSTPGSPEYRHYLAKGQFGARFGASTAVIDGLTSALTAYGLTVSPTADRLSLTVSGTAGKVEAAFNTPLVDYRLAGGRVAYLNTAAPTLPAGVAKDVMGVVGLSDVVQLQADAIPSPKAPGGMTRAPTPALRAHASGPSPCAAATADATDYGAWTSDSLASAYGFGTAYSAGDLGAGQTVALFELEPFSASDVTAFETCYGISTPVTTTNVDGGPGTGAGSGESILDIDVVASLAPSATIHVYQAPNSGSSTIDTYRQIATDDSAKVVSTSWGLCETALIGYSNQAMENAVYEEMAAQGQTLVAAAGDDGSEACYGVSGLTAAQQGALAVGDPASQPWVTGVGGTTLTAIGPPPSEVVWNEDVDTGYGAGGGGKSITWARPAWQSGTGTSGTARQVPDLSASADPVYGYVIYYDGEWTAEGGTSAAAPLTAALASLVDNSCPSGALGFLNPKLYSMATAGTGFHDITSGNNDYTGLNSGEYPATAGYDMASGLGSPNGSTWFTSACQTSVSSPTVTPAKNLTGASTTYSMKYSTSSSGAMPAGDFVTLVGPSGTTFTSTASNYTVAVGLGAPITATSAAAYDAKGSATPNAVILQLPTAVPASTAVTVQASNVTNAATAGTLAATVFTSADGAPATMSLTLAGAGSAGTSTASASPSSVEADGVASSTVTVTVRDGVGVPASGRSISLAQGTGHSVITTSPATTNASGVATFTVTDTTAEGVSYAVTDTTDSVALNGASVTFTTPKATVANSTVTASPSSVEADGIASSTVTVTLKDDNGVALAGKSVSLAAGSGSSVITTSPATTNSSGVATFAVTDTTAQAVTYTAIDTTDSVTLNGTGQSPTVTFTAPKATVANSTGTASPSSVEADGIASSKLTFILNADNSVALAV